MLAGGCWNGLGGPTRPPASALWLAADTVLPAAGTLGRLRALGVGEIFLEAGHIDTSGRLVRHAVAELPPGTAVTLVVTGGQRHVDTALAGRVDGDLRQLRFEAEGRGLVPIGLHFDLPAIIDLEAYAGFLDAVSDAGDRSLFLSCSLPRLWLERGGVGDVVDAVDAVVAFLYGQRPGEAEAPLAWDFVAVERGLERLEALGGRYFLGVSTLGLAYPLAGDGDAVTAARLRDFLWGGRFNLEPGFSLEGVNRMVYSVVANQDTSIGAWQLKRRDRVRIVRLAAAHIEEIQRLRGAWQLPGLLGVVYYRVPREGEKLSISTETLAAALEPTPATPRLSLEASLRRATGGGFIFRFGVSNHGPGTTELSVLENNILQVTVERGNVGRVEVGDFERFGLFHRDRAGILQPTFRDADTVQLHLPILEEGAVARTGDVEIRGAGEPALRVDAWFILPDGRTLALGPAIWRNGQLIEVDG